MPLPQFESRQKAGDLPPGLKLPVPPPPEFDPLKASNDLLIKHGLPPRPDQTSHPEKFVRWEKVCSGAGSYVTPGFERLPKTDLGTGDQISSNWSGAVISADPNYSFDEVWGSWIVSRPHPDNWAWQPQYWEPGQFAAGTWVGIDGHGESDDVLQAGVGHRCTPSTHQDTDYAIHPWWEWYPGGAWTITGFQVSPGDLVDVWITADSSTEASIYFWNYSACTYTSFSITAPTGVSLKGNCAEWIVEGHRGHNGKATMSYLGATFFFDCGAFEENTNSSKWKIRDLTNATYLEIKQNGQVLSTGMKEFSNAKVVGVVAERRIHEHRVP
ncbi:hypothetical protein DL769_008497 [Monosporascus sp. CRB-8-3]|nr:hypothetical protein DL769_008497 [Monosporascus sp. CRB-8-3]